MFAEAVPEKVEITGFAEWPLGVFVGWHGNRELVMKPYPDKQQTVAELNARPAIADLYAHQRAR